MSSQQTLLEKQKISQSTVVSEQTMHSWEYKVQKDSQYTEGVTGIIISRMIDYITKPQLHGGISNIYPSYHDLF